MFSPSINRLGLIAADGIKFFLTSIYLPSSELKVSQEDYRDLLSFGFVYHRGKNAVDTFCKCPAFCLLRL